MISIFSRMNNELASWIAIGRFLRGVERCGPNFTLGGEARPIFDLRTKHYKPRQRTGWRLKNLLLGLSCLIAGDSATAALTEQPYEIRARLDAAPGNITVTFDGRIITSLHQFYGPAHSVVELGRDGSLKPFPNAQFNDRTERTRDFRLDSVLGIRADREGIVWMLDNGLRSQVVPKLVGWDAKHDKLHRVIELPPPATPPDAFVNDFAIDPKHNAIYIADPAIDQSNNIYLGDLAANAIGVITPDRKYTRLAQSSDLSWVDSFSFGPQGELYAVVNRLHQSAVLNAGEALSKPPYFVLRVKTFDNGIPGR